MASSRAKESKSADVLVIGGGSAGSALTRRLVDAGLEVILVEAGMSDDDPAVNDPGTAHMIFGGVHDWGYTTVPQPALHNRQIPCARGRILGGSSCLNGMIYVRGARSDFDGWSAEGNSGWGYDDLLPLFRRAEDFDGGADEYHGVGGPLSVMSRYEPHPFEAAAVEAAIEAGEPSNADPNGARLDGASFPHLNIKDGVRHNTARAYLHPIAEAPNLTIRTGCVAQRLLFAGERCVGVEVLGPDGVEELRAEREVVVAGGSIDSPKLLMLSGIGPAADLRRLDIGVRADLPVGLNLHDHPDTPMVWSTSRPMPPAVPGLQQIHGMYFWRSESGLPAPDVQTLFAHVPLYDVSQSGPLDAFTLMNVVLRPESRGTLRLASADPAAAPLIDPGYMSSRADVDTAVAALQRARRVVAAPALREWVREELFPGPGVRTAAELEDYVRSRAWTTFHPVGTCRMGTDERAVVDPELKVRGIDGLRVADASIMPSVTTGNTHAPSVIIGEKAADLVIGTRVRESVAARNPE